MVVPQSERDIELPTSDTAGASDSRISNVHLEHHLNEKKGGQVAACVANKNLVWLRSSDA